MLLRSRRIAKFESNRSLNHPSQYSKSSLDLDMLTQYCAFSGGSSVFPLSNTDRMWDSPRPGLHAILDIYFEYGFRLPMHPIYLLVFEAFCCGLGQLVQTAILQINGVIARCRELGQFPTIDLLFSIFRVKSTGIQLYFDKK